MPMRSNLSALVMCLVLITFETAMAANDLGASATQSTVAALQSQKPNKASESNKNNIDFQNFNSIEAGINDALAVGNYDRALDLTMRLQELAKQSQDLKFEARAEGYLGVVARRRGMLDEAVQHHQRAIEIRKELRDDAGIANSLTNLGTTYRDLGRYSESLLAQLDAIELRRKIGVSERLDVNYRNIGLLYSDVEDYRTAEKFFELAEGAARQFDNPDDLAPVLGSYATLLNDLGEYGKALEKVREAFDLDAPRDHRYGMSLEHVEFARAFLGLGSLTDARTHTDMAFDLATQIGQPDVVGRALVLRGILHARDNNSDAAIQDLSEAVKILERHDLKRWALLGLDTLSKTHEKRGELKAALEFNRKHAHLREEILGLNAARRLGALESQRQREREQLEFEKKLREQQLDSVTARNRQIVAILGTGLLMALGFALFASYKRIRDLRRSNQEVVKQQEQLAQVNRRLRDQTQELKQAAVTDPLTGAFNRRYALDQIGVAMNDARSKRGDVGLLLVDLDHFKQVNDRFGHQFGDQVLVETTRLLQTGLREHDVLARMGGEEFIIVLPDSNRAAAAHVAERVRKTIETSLRVYEQRDTGVTASVGVAVLSQMQPDMNVDQFVNAADEAMYQAKHSARNAVRFYGE